MYKNNVSKLELTITFKDRVRIGKRQDKTRQGGHLEQGEMSVGAGNKGQNLSCYFPIYSDGLF